MPVKIAMNALLCIMTLSCLDGSPNGSTEAGINHSDSADLGCQLDWKDSIDMLEFDVLLPSILSQGKLLMDTMNGKYEYSSGDFHLLGSSYGMSRDLWDEYFQKLKVVEEKKFHTEDGTLDFIAYIGYTRKNESGQEEWIFVVRSAVEIHDLFTPAYSVIIIQGFGARKQLMKCIFEGILRRIPQPGLYVYR